MKELRLTPPQSQKAQCPPSRFHTKCEEFLVEQVGAAAAAPLEEAARADAYANVRTRAARLLPKVLPRR